MPHQCVRCNKLYEDGDSVILKGCPCGGRLFFFLKEEHLKKLPAEELSETSRREIEKDVFKILEVDRNDTPVVLDFESISVLKPGKYEIDLVRLFKGEPLIFKLADGKYVIDIESTFENMRKNKNT